MGGAGRDCGQLYSDGVLSRTTEHLSRDSHHTRMETPKSPPKTPSVVCYGTGSISENAFLRRKVASLIR